LIWLTTANCFSTQTYSAANQAAAGLAAGQCDLTDGSSAGDWRLPTNAEWQATVAQAVALGCMLPSLTNDPGTGCLSAGPTSFTVVQSSYWSSSVREDLPIGAWVANLPNASGPVTFLRTVGLFTWPVRGAR
jgi:hypothetical protein